MAAEPSPPSLSCDLPLRDGLPTSDDGTVRLHWQPGRSPDSGEFFRLEKSPDGSFRNPLVRYEGSDRSSVLSGLPEGDHHFRVRALSDDGTAGPWSASTTISVRFMDRHTLFALVGTGFLVASASVGAVIAGFIKTRKK